MNDEYVVAMAMELGSHEIEYGETEKIYLRKLRDASNPLERSERKFKKLFRISRSQAHYILNILCAGNELHEGTIPAHLKVFCALNFFAHGSYQTSVGEINIIAQSQPSVSRSLAAVCSLIIQRLTPHWIKFPLTRQEKARAMQEFQQLFGMPYTIGAVDGTHIGIHKPPINHPTAPGNLFYNRKGYYSINCQMICNANGHIINVNPNFPGATHDAAIWRTSNVNIHMESQYVENEEMQWLLGDKGYPLLPWLMTPCPEPAPGSPEERFNKCHAQARGVIEMCFGKLKGQMRCLHKHRILHYPPEKAAQIIISCCTIYNILCSSGIQETDSEDDSETDSELSSDDDDSSESELSEDSAHVSSESELSDDDDPENNQSEDFLNAGRARRAQLIQHFFT